MTTLLQLGVFPVSIVLAFVTVALAERNLRECLCVTITIDVIYQTQEQCFIEISQKNQNQCYLRPGIQNHSWL